MGMRQPKRGSGTPKGAPSARTISLDTVEAHDALDRKLIETLERIERLRSKAMLAAGLMLAEQR